jgi:hypothetical protein
VLHSPPPQPHTGFATRVASGTRATGGEAPAAARLRPRPVEEGARRTSDLRLRRLGVMALPPLRASNARASTTFSTETRHTRRFSTTDSTAFKDHTHHHHFSRPGPKEKLYMSSRLVAWVLICVAGSVYIQLQEREAALVGHLGLLGLV